MTLETGLKYVMIALAQNYLWINNQELNFAKLFMKGFFHSVHARGEMQ